MATMNKTDKGLALSRDITACHECDLLLKVNVLAHCAKTLCPRCGALLQEHSKNSLARTLALSITGLLLFIPANTLPILTFEILGKSNTSTMLNGIVLMVEDGYWWMSFMVFFCSVLAPLTKFVLLTITSAGCLLNGYKPLIIKAQKTYQFLDEWGMFDVYMLGVIVAFVKMKEYGDMVPGFGLLCFTLLLLVAAASSTVYDASKVWRHVYEPPDRGNDQ